MENIRNEDITVLIVDDNKSNLQIIAQVLHRSGYQVMMTTDGPHALELVQEKVPDAILLDIMMPGWDGFEVCRRLRLIRTISHVPIIFLSAKDEDTNIETGFEAGGTDYITKPFHEKILLARIRAHVERGYYLKNLEESNQVLRDKTHQLIEMKKNLEQLNRQLDQQIQKNLHFLAAINDQVRNPLAVAITLLDQCCHPHNEMIIEELRRIDAVIDNLDRGVIESEKVREYLRKYQNCDDLL
jgi:DNA-binding response OmpR family regulator